MNVLWAHHQNIFTMNDFIIRIALAVFSMVCLAGCSGVSDGEDLMVFLKTDVREFPADGKSKVKFSVFEGKADVTSKAAVYEYETGKPLTVNEFSTTVAGTYAFYAEYNGKKSESVSVTAEPVIESRFVRNVCLMEFTDGSCSFCPDASRYIDRNILGKYENVHLMAFHEKDEWKSDQFPELFAKFQLTGTPGASVDMRGGISLAAGDRDKVKSAIADSEERYTAHCAVAVSSVKDESGNAVITAKIFSEMSSEYYLAVYIVEDGIKGYQLDGSLDQDNYYHQFVVRKLLSTNVYGDSMGRIAAENEKAKEYQVICDGSWNLSKTYVYALAIDKQGYVINMQVCLIEGGDAEYEYLK